MNSFNRQADSQQQQQYINIPTIYQAGVQRNNIPAGPLGPPKPVWKYFRDLEIFREKNTSWRLCICTIDDQPYACISHWFWSNTTVQWMPSTRQVNLPKEVFIQLGK